MLIGCTDNYIGFVYNNKSMLMMRKTMFLIEQLHWNLIFIGGGIILVFTIFIMLFFIDQKKEIQAEKLVKSKSAAIRIFMLDLINNSVLCFSRSEIRQKTIGGIDIFYKQFHPSERERINQWFYDLLAEKPDTPSYLEADVISEGKKQPFFLLLQTYKIDRGHKRIYLESTRLRSIHPHVRPRKHHKFPTMITTEPRMRAYFERNQGKLRGTTTLIRFYKLNFHQTSTLPIEHHLAVVLQDKLIGFLGNGRYLLAYSDLEIALFDVKSIGRTLALQIARIVADEMAAYLDINGLKDNYSFSLGIAENNQPLATYESILESARAAAIMAEEGKKKIAFYEGGPNTTPSENRVFSHELERLIKERKVNVSFRPIIDVNKAEPMGYFAYLEPYDSVFNNLRELREYAFKTEQHKELFSLLAKKAIPRFFSQRDGEHLHLFFPVSLIDDFSISKILGRINHSKDVKLVLSFAEEELSFALNNLDTFSEQLNNYQQLGYEVALVIHDVDLTLPSAVYSQFNYFVINNSIVARLKNDERQRTQLSSVLEKLIKFNQPIILSDLENWSSIELVIQMGINLVSAEEISPRNEMVIPVERKKINRLKSFAE